MSGLVLLLIALGGFVLVVALLGGIVLALSGNKEDAPKTDVDKSHDKGTIDVLVYEQADSFLSEAELNFYKVLCDVVKNPIEANGQAQAVVMSKVRVLDLIRVRKGLDKSSYRSAFNRIKAKHVDFVLCEPSTMRAMCVIELDDKSHQRKSRVERDQLMDSIYAAAGLPIVHVDCRRGYSMQEVGGMIREAVGSGV